MSTILFLGAVNHFFQFQRFGLNCTFHTDLGLIDLLLTNQNAEIVACILPGKQL